MGTRPPRRDATPPIDPGQSRRRPPRPPIPWTPFGPGDNATPDIARLEKRVAKIQKGLEDTQIELTRMRHGPGPDGTPPTVREVTRADGLWPYLVIRTYPGDVGKRPMQPSDTVPPWSTPMNSPDVILTGAGPAGEPAIIERAGIEAVKLRELHNLNAGSTYDVWVHVWNLGRFQATGVRVLARLGPSPYNYPNSPDPAERHLGGIVVDLGDRLSETAHRAVKVATFTADSLGDDYWMLITATAECLSDVATGDFSPGADRHSAHCAIEASS